MTREAVSKKQNPNYKQGRLSHKGAALRQLDWWWPSNGDTSLDWWLSEKLKFNLPGSSGTSVVQAWMARDLFAPSSIHSVNKCVLITLPVLGSVPGAEDRTMSKTQTLSRRSSLASRVNSHSKCSMYVKWPGIMTWIQFKRGLRLNQLGTPGLVFLCLLFKFNFSSDAFLLYFRKVSAKLKKRKS